jgi:hypothetical protein
VQSATLLGRIARKLDALPAVAGAGTPSCASSGGRSEVIFFHYRGAADDQVRIEGQSCTTVSNGRLLRRGLPLPKGSHWGDEGLI